MRIYESNNITVTYPENMVWLYDSNCIKVESGNPNDSVGADITIRHPNGTMSRTITHVSDLSRLLFVIDDALMAMYNENIGLYTVQVDVYLNGVACDIVTFTFQLLEGKSFSNRSHGISRTIYIYKPEELAKVQIYSPANGLFTVGNSTYPLTEGLNQYNLGWYVTDIGSYTVCLGDAVTPPIALISGDTPIAPITHELYYAVSGGGTPTSEVKGGDIWKNDEVTFPICHTIVYDTSCDGSDFIELRYRDCDGCYRYLGGKIVKETNKASGSPYTRVSGTDQYRNIPRRHIVSNSRSVNVGFYDIATDAYAQDIRYSSEVHMRTYDGDWWPVAVATESIVTKNEDTQDIELEIIISEEL